MRVVLQRVSRGEVRIDGKTVGRVGRGFVLLAGFAPTDEDGVLRWMADKVSALRLFPDDAGLMNLSLDDVDGGVLVISQFTLYGDARKGRRPSFTGAAPPDLAIPLYERFLSLLETRLPGRVQSGEFGAMMEVEIVNDGPVTLVLER
ncbi:MAG TPA: D-aminoacyl-tRNA deacylase [Longimicrobiales bacterium]|nr:D-aminoacyl-tRNA deacylase [Longimicrobiales bacterium]